MNLSPDFGGPACVLSLTLSTSQISLKQLRKKETRIKRESLGERRKGRRRRGREGAEKKERSEKKGDVACGHIEGADAANSHSWVKDPQCHSLFTTPDGDPRPSLQTLKPHPGFHLSQPDQNSCLPPPQDSSSPPGTHTPPIHGLNDSRGFGYGLIDFCYFMELVSLAL